jgi:hypothetical protein
MRLHPRIAICRVSTVKDLMAALLAVALASGCAPEHTARVVLGSTNVNQLQQQIGQPTQVKILPSETEMRRQSQGQPPSAQPAQVQILKYPDRGETYQATPGANGTITAMTREPDGQESTLQYWRHRWVGVEKVEREVPGSRDKHGHSLTELKAPSLNMAVIYDPSRDVVTQVVEYGSAK